MCGSVRLSKTTIAFPWPRLVSTLHISSCVIRKTFSPSTTTRRCWRRSSPISSPNSSVVPASQSPYLGGLPFFSISGTVLASGSVTEMCSGHGRSRAGGGCASSIRLFVATVESSWAQHRFACSSEGWQSRSDCTFALSLLDGHPRHRMRATRPRCPKHSNPAEARRLSSTGWDAMSDEDRLYAFVAVQWTVSSTTTPVVDQQTVMKKLHNHASGDKLDREVNRSHTKQAFQILDYAQLGVFKQKARPNSSSNKSIWGLPLCFS